MEIYGSEESKFFGRAASLLAIIGTRALRLIIREKILIRKEPRIR